MTITITISDQDKQARIERLRGNLAAEAFATRCLEAGLAAAETQMRKNAKIAKRIPAKPEFHTLDVAAITAALKNQDAAHPVKLEVGRLVQAYSAQLKAHMAKDKNNQKQALRINAPTIIERIALQITTQAMNKADVKNLGNAA